MTVEDNIKEMQKSLKCLERTKIYDVEKYTCSLLHQTKQLEYFYCHLVKDHESKCDDTFYYVGHRPKENQLAYFNIGRGFPKELMDGHWCYILKDFGYKMVVIPCTSIKDDKCNNDFEKDITVIMYNHKTKSRLQISDIRTVDIQRLDLRKPFCQVLTDQDQIMEFVKNKLF